MPLWPFASTPGVFLRQQTESWRRCGPPCCPSCCPAARCPNRDTAAAPRARRSSQLPSGTCRSPRTACVSSRRDSTSIPSRSRSRVTEGRAPPPLSPCRSRQPPADLPADAQRRPIPEEGGHGRDLLPAAHITQPAAPGHLQQRAQQQQVRTSHLDLHKRQRLPYITYFIFFQFTASLSAGPFVTSQRNYYQNCCVLQHSLRGTES